MVKHILALGLILASVAVADTATSTSPWSFSKEAYVRETSDNNIYTAGSGSLGNKYSSITTAGLNLKATYKLSNGSLALSFNPEFNSFAQESSQDFWANVFGAALKVKYSDWNIAAQTSNRWVAGNHSAPVYLNDAAAALSSGFGATPVALRVDQLQTTNSFKVSREWTSWMFEGVGSLVATDFMSRHSTETGYLNGTDRREMNAGFNVGYKVQPKLWVLAGYRLGQQHDNLRPGTALQYCNNYQQFLTGLRGELPYGVKVDFLVGVDFRAFNSSTAAGFDNTQTFWHYEGTASYAPTKVDSFSVAAKHLTQVGWTGGSVYQDNGINFKYGRKINEEFSAEAAMQMTFRDYLAGSSTRNETLYAPSVSVTYKPASVKDLTVKASYTYESVQSNTPAVTAAENEYQRNIFALEARYAF